MKSSTITTAVVGVLASLSGTAHAITVGEAKVLSFSNQPLRVLIPLKAAGWEWRAMWASAQTYQKGLGLSATLYKPQGEKTDGFIEIRSISPITEPIIDLQITFDTGHRTTIHRTPILIDVDNKQEALILNPRQESPLSKWSNGIPRQIQSRPVGNRVPSNNGVDNERERDTAGEPLRTDMPEVVSPIPLPPSLVRASTYSPLPTFNESSVKASQPAFKRNKRGELVPDNTQLEPSVSTGRNAVSSSKHETYLVQKGDTLYGIASKHRSKLWSIEETMKHIHAANPKAFAGKAYKTLKAGATLVLNGGEAPQPQEMTSNVQDESQSSKAANAMAAQSMETSTASVETAQRKAVLREQVRRMQEELNTLEQQLNSP